MYRTTDAGGLNEPDTAPIAPVWSAHRLGGGDLLVPRREAQSLGLVPNRRELCPDALAILPGDDPGSDPLFGRPRLRPWHRTLGSGTVIDDDRCPDRLSQAAGTLAARRSEVVEQVTLESVQAAKPKSG